MNMKTHYLLMKNILDSIPYPDRVNGLDRILILSGATITDISPSRFFHAHYYLKSLEYICSQIQKLEKKEHWNKRDIFNAGKQFHYLMDFFCAMHQGKGLRKPAKHVKYERDLYIYISEKDGGSEREYIPSVFIRDKWIQNLHEKYESKEVSFENDIAYSAAACKTFMYMVVSKIQKHPITQADLEPGEFSMQ